MKKILLFISILLSIGFVFSISGCKKNEAGNKGELEFEYYPAKNIYYNVATSKFIYSLDGGKSWDSAKLTSKDAFALLGKKQKVYSKTPEIWKDNKAHLKTYSGVLFHVIHDSVNTDLAVMDEVSDKRKSSRVPTAKQPVQQNRKGIRGFFDRVFKKKDKK